MRQVLESLCRTAAVIGVKGFFMPRNRGDQAIAEAAGIYAEQAEPLKQAFIDHRMPADFILHLKAGAQALGQSVKKQASSKSARKSATTAIDEARVEAIAALQRVEPIMENILGDNLPLLSAWASARRVQKPAGPAKSARKEESNAPSPPTPSLPETSSISASAERRLAPRVRP